MEAGFNVPLELLSTANREALNSGKLSGLRKICP